MSLTERAFLGSPTAPASIEALRRQYACGAVDLTGSPHALYDRHLFFENVMHPAAAGLRERCEAVARSLRDVLSQRWIHTEQSYERNNPKRMPPPPGWAPSWGSRASRRRRLGSRSMQAVAGVRRGPKGGVLAMAKADLDSLKESLPLIEIEYLRHAATELGLDDLEGCALEKLANLHELTRSTPRCTARTGAGLPSWSVNGGGGCFAADGLGLRGHGAQGDPATGSLSAA